MQVEFSFINKNSVRFLLKDASNVFLKILADPLDIWLDNLYLLLEELHEFEDRVIWSFTLTSEESLKNFELLVDKFKIPHYEYHVLFNGHNMDFLMERCFLSEEDIWQTKLGIKDIFANQIINKNYFGKLVICSDGTIYEDLNSPSIGSLSDNLESLLFSLIWNEGAWLKTRCNDTCNNCIYRFLCPPPSGLEGYLQRKTVCNFNT